MISWVKDKIIRETINLYGRRIFLTDTVLNRREDMYYIFNDLNLKVSSYVFSDTCILLTRGVIKGLKTDLHHTNINEIELDLELSKATHRDPLTVSFSQDNDLSNAFNDIRNYLISYIQTMHVQINTITTSFGTLSNICWTSGRITIDSIESPYAKLKGITYDDCLKIEYIELLDLTSIPTVWLQDGDGRVEIKEFVYEDVKGWIVLDDVIEGVIYAPGLVINLPNRITITNLLDAYTWLKDVSKVINVLSERIVKPHSATVIDLILDGNIKGTVSCTYDEDIIDLLIETSEWTVCCDKICLNPLTVIKGVITNADKLWLLSKQLPSDGSTNIRLHDCKISAFDFIWEGSLVMNESIQDIDCTVSVGDVKAFVIKAQFLDIIEQLHIHLTYGVIKAFMFMQKSKPSYPKTNIMHEPIIIESYIANNKPEEKTERTYIFDFIESYVRVPDTLFASKIKSFTIDIGNPFVRIVLDGMTVKQTQDLLATIFGEPDTITQVDTSVIVLDLYSDSWRNMITIPHLQLKYVNRSGRHNVSIHCSKVDIRAREKTLRKLQKIIPSKGGSDGWVDQLSVSHIDLSLSILPALTEGIPVAISHQVTLPAIIIKHNTVTHVVDKLISEWFKKINLIQVIAQPCINPIYKFCTTIGNFLSRISLF